VACIRKGSRDNKLIPGALAHSLAALANQEVWLDVWRRRIVDG
jgi:hypothetical protein